MHINDFDYELPLELIAQTPAEKRDSSRLMVVDRKNGNVEHKHFYDVIDYLKPGDCLVLNNSKVLPARLYGVKEGTGAKVEFLLIKRLEGDTWETMVRPGKRLKVGDAVSFSEDKLFRAVIKDYGEDGTRIVEFEYEGIFLERLEELGKMPLPPYIERENTLEDKERYQTVYCKTEGSVAAPTAGLHFTKELLEQAKEKGVNLVLAVDAKIADAFSNDANTKFCPVNEIPDGWEGLDIGPKTEEIFANVIKGSKTILWNGPTGVFEFDNFTHGSRTVGEAIVEATKNGAFSLVGGGDSVACVNKFGLANGVSYVSTGGGALLEAIEGKILPGIAAIQE